jgi:NADPH2:quinone reductase
MSTGQSRSALQLRSLVTDSGELELALASVPIPQPGPDEVLIRVEASPLNPSDIGLLLGPADMTSARFSGTVLRPVVTARIPDNARKAMNGRIGESMPVGNEGAGVVVAAGFSAAAQKLMGKTVAAIGGGMYSQYRCVRADQCLALPAGATPVDGASCFVNPLTALGMVETMRREGHTALVHTAAASNLGQMLVRICRQDEIGLVNIVRKPEQVEILRALGATHVCNAGAPTFTEDLTEAIVATGATIAFDATGGGRLAGQILTSMEMAIGRKAKAYSRYGSSTHKQVYLYGRLDASPIELTGSFGMAWGIGGWLVFPYMEKIGHETAQRLRERVVAELKTTFASRYSRVVSLREALQPDAIAAYSKRATGEKYLINPNKDVPEHE